jgi:hypothetical protein
MYQNDPKTKKKYYYKIKIKIKFFQKYSWNVKANKPRSKILIRVQAHLESELDVKGCIIVYCWRVITSVVRITRFDFGQKDSTDLCTVSVLFLEQFRWEMDKWKIAKEKEGREHLYGIETRPQITSTKLVYFVCLLGLNTFSFAMSISMLHSKGLMSKCMNVNMVVLFLFWAKELAQ